MASSSKAPDEIERLLNREATAFQREIEVDRILKAFKLKSVPYASNLHILTHDAHQSLSPYEILDLPETATPEDVKKKYRHLSLCEPSTRLSDYCCAYLQLVAVLVVVV